MLNENTVSTPDGVVTRMVNEPVVAVFALVIVMGNEPGSVVQGTVNELGCPSVMPVPATVAEIVV